MCFKNLFKKSKNGAGDYSIPMVRLDVMPEGTPDELKYLYELSVVDNELDYLGHPDAVLLKDGSILDVYPSGHGKGAIRSSISLDGGVTYSSKIENMPKSWETSRETPTVYRLEFADGTPDKILLISGNPNWHDGKGTIGGFNFSLSDDEGKTWSEFELCFAKKDGFKIIPIVSMASLTRLKENGVFVDKWMAFFHNPDFINFKTILSFVDGKPVWSKPEPYFSQHRAIEKKANMCEVEVVRSDCGKGDELCLIARSNNKDYNSLLSFSQDEGKTWSAPVFAPSALNGERHKADYTSDGRLFITFRSIERCEEKIKKNSIENMKNWYSEGWVAWVGTYDDLKNGTEGQYRIKLAHTYLDKQTEPSICANADTGYCGNVVLDDGTIVTSTYGQFGEKKADGKYKTYVASKRLKLSDVEKLIR
ncbi:MAG: sialidase family protein [Acutalibacteraceae bacterium]|nr:sialidase family protein [Acutalibacteraceae bacterium]